ncbi:two-component system response regulator YesN [Paenibacillus wynnii]|nr:two-component system response regulator YesN [Paenibacillus wynnii]
MTRRILEIHPHCKIIILSAYTDFEYAKQAIRLGAFDFVKKPFSIQDITKAVLDAKEVLERENERKLQIQHMERKVDESLPLLRQEYMGRLLRHETKPEDAKRYWEEMQGGDKPERLAVFLIEIDSFQYLSQPIHDIELARYTLQQIFKDTIGQANRGLVCRDGPNSYAGIIGCGELSETRRLAEECCANIASGTEFSVSVGIGKAVSELHELPQSYKSAMKALASHIHEEGNAVFDDLNPPQEEEFYPRYAVELERELLLALRSGSIEQSSNALDLIFNDMHRIYPLPDPLYLRSLYFELAFVVLRALYEWVPEAVMLPFHQAIRGRDGQGEFTIKYFQQLIKDMCSAGCDWIERERMSDAERLIYRATEYIRAHLHLDLTVEHCARQMNLSGGYFASQFKKHSGVTFNQFVTNERIERAKLLLIENYQVQEIAQSLGYEHRRYFSDVFKRVTGQTPSEFRDAYMGQR